MKPYTVRARNWNPAYLINQFQTLTTDGHRDENSAANCGETCVAMLARLYGKPYIAPDTIKDWILGQGRTGVISTNVDLEKAIAHFVGITAVTHVPNGERHASAGLLDLEYQALKAGRAVIWLGYWIDRAGTEHRDITHWRLAVSQTAIAVTSADPSFGVMRTQSYAAHYENSAQLLVIPSRTP